MFGSSKSDSIKLSLSSKLLLEYEKKNHSKAACMLDWQQGNKNKHCVIISVRKITTLLQQEDQMSDSF